MPASGLCGTASHLPTLPAIYSPTSRRSKLDTGDISSDDGDPLHTPVSEITQLIRVACPSAPMHPPENGIRHEASCNSQGTSGSLDSLFPMDLPTKRIRDSPPGRDRTVPPFGDLPSSFPITPSNVDHAGVAETSLLHTTCASGGNGRSPGSASASSSVSGHLQQTDGESRPASGVGPTSASTQLASSARKRSTSSRSLRGSGRPGQKPKFSEKHSPPVPSTLARLYSNRFPAGHRLSSKFIEEYALDRDLGRGAFGFVMAAKRRQDSEAVAVKFIARDWVPRYGWGIDEDGKRVPKEARILRMLDHPRIIKFIDLFEDHLFFYLVQELHGRSWTNGKECNPSGKMLEIKYHETVDKSENSDGYSHGEHPSSRLSAKNTVDNALTPVVDREMSQPSQASHSFMVRKESYDLFECIETLKGKGGFREEDAKYIFAQVVDTVSYLDSLGITHCDIKDENIVIDKNLRIKLIDFGSYVSVDPTKPRPFYQELFGTTAYASPEVLNRLPYHAQPAEIWSLGILLSFLISGSFPFLLEGDILKGRVTVDKKTRSRISNECLHLLNWCLETDPKKRPIIAEVANHPWLNGALSREEK